MELNDITGDIISASIFVHKSLGPGLLESVYEKCLQYELIDRGFTVDVQIPVDIKYRGIEFSEAFRADLLVEGKVIVELKSIELIKPVHKKQLLTYLKLMDLRVGLLINFGEVYLMDGVCRLVNDF